MTLDGLRTHLLISWLAFFVFSCCLIGLELVLTPHLRDGQLNPLFYNLCKAALPTIGLMISLYFVAELLPVKLTKGQKTVGLVLSYIYLFGITLITVYALWYGSNLSQKNGSSYETLLSIQPILVGTLGYIFGQSVKRK